MPRMAGRTRRKDGPHGGRGHLRQDAWCPRGFVTIEEALAQIDLGLDGRLGEDVRAAIRRLSAHREQMPDDLGDLEDAIVRELTRDGHGQLDTVAAAPILADLLEMELDIADTAAMRLSRRT